MTTAESQAILAMLRTLAASWGPLAQAGDYAPIPLLAAQVNADLLSPGWCQCEEPSRPHAGEVYFRRPTGSHGWMCSKCRRITQAG